MTTSSKKFKMPKNTCRMSLDMDKQLHKKIKIAAAKKMMTMRALLVDIIRNHFSGDAT